MKLESPATFESLLQLIEQLPNPPSEDVREVHWCESSHVVGVSRRHRGQIEIFLCGEELRPSSPIVKRHMRFDQWARAGGEVFRANRLVLPSDSHYIAVAAFLAEELLRRDVMQSLATGFAETEPLIEMALGRTTLTEEEILGLIGELRFLDALLACATDQHAKAQALDAWRGHERGSRDFVAGTCGVEVKTTRGHRSRHGISNVMQVDPRRSHSNDPQESLFLLSLGFRAVEASPSGKMGLSLPDLVEAILEKLAPTGLPIGAGTLGDLFLSKLSRYGASSGRGYVHEEMKHWSAYQVRWQPSFLRIYDMGDDAIKVLRRSDIQQCGHVVFETVSFDIDLPEKISGDLNPQGDLFALARNFLSF